MALNTVSLDDLSYDHYEALRKVDEQKIGTADYQGIAWFWAYAYRYPLRDASPAVRKVVHDALLAAGLKVDGESAKHGRIIAKHGEL